MILLNFSHPLTPDQLDRISALCGRPINLVFPLSTHFNVHQSLGPQVAALVSGIGLESHEWQTTGILVNLPSLNFVAALVLAELHGRMGYFPPVVRLRPAKGVLSSHDEVAEILNLQAIRDEARTRH